MILRIHSATRVVFSAWRDSDPTLPIGFEEVVVTGPVDLRPPPNAPCWRLTPELRLVPATLAQALAARWPPVWEAELARRAAALRQSVVDAAADGALQPSVSAFFTRLLDLGEP